MVHWASSRHSSSITVSHTCSGTCFTMLVHCCSEVVAHCCSGTSLVTVAHSCSVWVVHSSLVSVLVSATLVVEHTLSVTVEQT